jgi:chromosome transmission fidelity protein 1
MSLTLTPPEVFSAFPYTPPYPIQSDLMHHLYECIEHKKVSIIESPTGTVSGFFSFATFVYVVLINRLSRYDREKPLAYCALVSLGWPTRRTVQGRERWWHMLLTTASPILSQY